MTAHENLERNDAAVGSSDKTFGLVFTAFLLVVALMPVLHGHAARTWALAASAVFLTAALAYPSLLAPLNRVWTGLGLLLHQITNPLLLGAVFFLVFTPFGCVLRLLGKDFLRLKKPARPDTYWIPRDPPGPPPESIKDQF